MQDKRFCYAEFGRGNNVDLVRYVLFTRPWWVEVKENEPFNLRWQMFAPDIKMYNEAIAGTEIYSHLPNFKCLHSKIDYYRLLTKYFPSECFDFVMPTYLFYGADKERFQRHFDYIAGKLRPEESEELTQEEHHTDPEAFSRNLWILKPESLNRGRGIIVVDSVEAAEAHVKECGRVKITNVETIEDISNAGGHSLWLIEKYIESPLLISSRKFDIRAYALALANGDCYIYKTGYLRLSGAEFSLESTDLAIHLTNNAVEQHIDTYQTFEEGNMMSFQQFEKYLGDAADFNGKIWPQIQQIMARTMEIASLKLIQKAECKNCFELFGFDFMIDSQYNPWAIEVNSNPCLELSSAVSWSILPYMLDDMFELTVDKAFPPPQEVVEIYRQRVGQCEAREQPTHQEFSAVPPHERRITGLKWQCLYCDETSSRKNGFIQVVRRFKRCRDFVSSK